MKQQTTWKITEKRFVSFLDIMGFKDIVSRNPHNSVFNIMKDISNFVRLLNTAKTSIKFNYKSIYTINFSDSIILLSEDDSSESFTIFTMANCWLFGHMIAHSIPLKGTMAYGLISVDKENQIYFGQPLIDSYLLQDEIQYYGLVAHHSYEKILIDHAKSKFSNLYFNAKTPLKSGNIEHINLDWTPGYKIAIKNEKNKIDFINKIKSFRTQTSGYPRKYIDNTVYLFDQKITTTNEQAASMRGLSVKKVVVANKIKTKSKDKIC